ncbi:hypothetical protein NPIL_2361 [Nephila pilipes]|uniref:Uncharacterized protein n=1 Tax=Nephila pilipes TaxID=299642 RepID=A0A8X6QBG9_NEPPI|nr:hypothetical protein NPIL_2361 [Nephila pilipes]
MRKKKALKIEFNIPIFTQREEIPKSCHEIRVDPEFFPPVSPYLVDEREKKEIEVFLSPKAISRWIAQKSEIRFPFQKLKKPDLVPLKRQIGFALQLVLNQSISEECLMFFLSTTAFSTEENVAFYDWALVAKRFLRDPLIAVVARRMARNEECAWYQD